jgi:hypothetical protein
MVTTDSKAQPPAEFHAREQESPDPNLRYDIDIAGNLFARRALAANEKAEVTP